MRGLRDELGGEKKRRKRAEKALGDGGASAEALRNQLVHLRARLEEADRENRSLKHRQTKQNDELFMAENQTAECGSEGMAAGVSKWHLQRLQSTLEEKEKLIESQRLEINRVKLLESKLIAANSKINGLFQSAQMEKSREQIMSISESERWKAREMINKERELMLEQEKRDVSQFSSSFGADGDARRATPTNTLARIPSNATMSRHNSITSVGSLPHNDSSEYTFDSHFASSSSPGVGAGAGGGAPHGASMSSLNRHDSGSWRPKPPAKPVVIQARGLL